MNMRSERPSVSFVSTPNMCSTERDTVNVPVCELWGDETASRPILSGDFVRAKPCLRLILNSEQCAD